MYAANPPHCMLVEAIIVVGEVTVPPATIRLWHNCFLYTGPASRFPWESTTLRVMMISSLWASVMPPPPHSLGPQRLRTFAIESRRPPRPAAVSERICAAHRRSSLSARYNSRREPWRARCSWFAASEDAMPSSRWRLRRGGGLPVDAQARTSRALPPAGGVYDGPRLRHRAGAAFLCGCAGASDALVA